MNFTKRRHKDKKKNARKKKINLQCWEMKRRENSSKHEKTLDEIIVCKTTTDNVKKIETHKERWKATIKCQ